MTHPDGLSFVVEHSSGERGLLYLNIDLSNVPKYVWENMSEEWEEVSGKMCVKSFGVDYSEIEPFLSETDKETIKQRVKRRSK